MSLHQISSDLSAALQLKASNAELKLILDRSEKYKDIHSQLNLEGLLFDYPVELDFSAVPQQVVLKACTTSAKLTCKGNFHSGFYTLEHRGDLRLKLTSGSNISTLNFHFSDMLHEATVALELESSGDAKIDVGQIAFRARSATVDFQPFSTKNLKITSIALEGNAKHSSGVAKFNRTEFLNGIDRFTPFTTVKTLEFEECAIKNITFPDSVLANLTFKNCAFSKLLISKTVFHQPVSFENSSFKDENGDFADLEFNVCNFNRTSNFDQINAREFRLNNTQLNESCSVQNVKVAFIKFADMPRIESLKIKLQDNTPASIFISGLRSEKFTLNSGDIEIKNSTLSRAEFQNIECEGRFTLSKNKIDKLICKSLTFNNQVAIEDNAVTSYPEFFGSKFFHDTSFSRSIFSDESRKAEGAYRFLKNAMALISNEVDEAHFGGFELACRQRLLKETRGPLLERILMSAYRGINDLGRAPFQPAKLLTLLALTGSFVYIWMPMSFSLTSKEPWAEHIDLNSLWHPFMFSMVNTMGPMKYLIRGTFFSSTTPAGFFLASLHVTLSSLLWFFLIIGVRRRFRT